MTHWYEIGTGIPRYTVRTADGKRDRATTLADARKLGLVPSVTGIMDVLAKPALNRWLFNNGCRASEAMPRQPGESDEAWFARLDAEARRPGEEAADTGTEAHNALEAWFKREDGVSPSDRWLTHCGAVQDVLDGHFGGRDWQAERSFAHPLGFGGKCDLSAPGLIVDFKTKPRIEAGKRYAWDNHPMQLAAYAIGLQALHTSVPSLDDWRQITLANVFVGVECGTALLHVYTPEEAAKGWRMFRAALTVWQEQNNYRPGADQDKAA
jgi:hypothetical protein